MPLIELYLQKQRGPAAKAQFTESINDELGLLGRSPGPEDLAKIEKLALSVPGVLGVHDLRAEYIGPDTVHAGMHIEVRSGLTIEEANQIAEEVDQRIHHGVHSGYCFIRVDATKQTEQLEQMEMTG